MILAVIQARMTSKRLPGKALSPLQGQPMIWRQLERVRRARCLAKVMVATSCEASDDPLAAWLVSKGQPVFRGAPTDLLDRFARCAASAGQFSHVVRIKGDAPFVDPALIDDAVRLALASKAAYVSNRNPSTYPLGLEVEVMTAAALNTAAAQPRDVREKVSPTAFIRANPQRFVLAHMAGAKDWSKLDWRVKTSADLAFARSVYGALHPADPQFGMDDILDVIGGRQDLARLTSSAA